VSRKTSVLVRNCMRFPTLTKVQIFLTFLLAACATPTRSALIRRDAEQRLASCLNSVRVFSERRECFQLAAQRCIDEGLEASCASDGYFLRF
jgi:hypothetical protein